MKSKSDSSAMPVRTLETRTSTYILRDDGIIVQSIHGGHKQTLADAKENIAAFTALADGKKHPVLVDGRASFSSEPGVREYYAGPEALAPSLAVAMLVGSMATRILFNIFMTVNTPKVPIRMFTDEVEAVAWLNKMSALHGRMGR